MAMQTITTILSVLSFTTLHLVSDRIFCRFLSRKKLSRLSPDDRINLSEKVCSTLHALIMSFVAFYLLFIADDAFTDIWTSFPRLLEFAFPVYLGYSLYDMGTMCFQNHHWSMWLHHLLGIAGSLLMMISRTGTMYATFFMVTEITAVTDNLNWYIKTLVIPDMEEPRRSFFRDNVLPFGRAASFVFGRVWVGPFALDKSAEMCGGWIGLWKGWARLPLKLTIPGFSIILLFCLLNFVWTHVICLKWMFPRDRKDD